MANTTEKMGRKRRKSSMKSIIARKVYKHLQDAELSIEGVYDLVDRMVKEKIPVKYKNALIGLQVANRLLKAKTGYELWALVIKVRATHMGKSVYFTIEQTATLGEVREKAIRLLKNKKAFGKLYGNAEKRIQMGFPDGTEFNANVMNESLVVLAERQGRGFIQNYPPQNGKSPYLHISMKLTLPGPTNGGD